MTPKSALNYTLCTQKRKDPLPKKSTQGQTYTYKESTKNLTDKESHYSMPRSVHTILSEAKK